MSLFKFEFLTADGSSMSDGTSGFVVGCLARFRGFFAACTGKGTFSSAIFGRFTFCTLGFVLLLAFSLRTLFAFLCYYSHMENAHVINSSSYISHKFRAILHSSRESSFSLDQLAASTLLVSISVRHFP